MIEITTILKKLDDSIYNDIEPTCQNAWARGIIRGNNDLIIEIKQWIRGEYNEPKET